MRIYSVPDLKAVLSISLDFVDTTALDANGFASDFASARHPCHLSQVSAVRRPISRWSGGQGSARHPEFPRGMLFVAGILADGHEVACGGSAVLMEWALGPTPVCHGAHIAHGSPIVAIAYGPYDNGPLITADASGVFRIWDYAPRLFCSQEVDACGAVTLSPITEPHAPPGASGFGVPCAASRRDCGGTAAPPVAIYDAPRGKISNVPTFLPPEGGMSGMRCANPKEADLDKVTPPLTTPAIAVDPIRRIVYSVIGDRRLFVWTHI